MIKQKTKDVIKILEDNKLTNIYSPEDQIKMQLNKVEDFKEHADKEQQELDESMKESFRQRDERKKRERLANQRVAGSVNFQEEGEFIFCSKCGDNTVHNPKFGACMKCGLEEYNDRKEGLN